MTAFSFNRPLIWHDGPPVAADCPACGARTEAAFRVRSHVVKDGTPVRFYTCGACASVFPHPFVQPGYEDDYGAEDFARLYTHFWAGIEFMTRPIVAASRLRRVRCFVDVGCGFGYTVDFARRMLGARALGLDPSPYARVGARALGIDILPRALNDEPLPDGQQADVILASEVIEHVDDPPGFLRTLRRHLAPGGLLVLTTPDACSIDPQQSPTLVLTALCIGFHRQIFVANTLGDRLREVGFQHVVIRETGGRLIAFASDAPFEAPDVDAPGDHYPRYLSLLAGATSPEAVDVRQGALYRLLEYHVAHGAWSAATDALAQADGMLRAHWGLTVDEPEAIATLLAAARDPADFAGRGPYWLPLALYFAGMLALNGHSDPVLARRRFGAAHRTIARLIQLDLPAESHLCWLAALHEGIAALVAGDASSAGALFDRIITPEAMPPALTIAERPDRTTVLRACLQRGVARVRVGQVPAAAADFARALGQPGLLTDPELELARTLSAACATHAATA